MMEAPERRALDVSPATLLLLCWAVLGTSVASSNGHYDHWALAGVVTAAVVATGGVVMLARERGSASASGLTRGETPAAAPVAGGDLFLSALGLAVGAAIAAAILAPGGIYGTGTMLFLARGSFVLATLAAAGALLVRPVAARTAGAVAVGLAVLGSLLMIVASPRPAIDVWFFLTQGAERTLEGVNAYAACWVGNTDRSTDCVYPYLPGQILVDIPFVLAGDVRYASVAALAIAAVFVSRIAMGRTGAVLAALVILQPKALFLVEQAWTEPVLLAALCGMVWATLTGRPVVAIAAFALAIACKQHVLLFVPLAAWWPAFGWRRAVIAVATAALVSAPWFLAGPTEFLADVVAYHLGVPPRSDALTLFAWITEQGSAPQFAVVVGGTLFAMALCVAELPRDARGFTVGSAFVLLVFNLLNKQSFFNQYALVLGLVVLAGAVLARHGDGPIRDEAAEAAEAGRALPQSA